nr:hypothetical protein BaRGS_023725 [Batillaria attramentaria]
MYFTFNNVVNSTAEIQHALGYHDVRYTRAKLVQSATPRSDMTFDVPWTGPTASSMQTTSAVCWLFGQYLHDHLQVPIGLIETSWGGTRIEAWSPPEAIHQCDGVSKRGPGANSVLWNSMIHPILSTTIYGAIWYQGESNAGQPTKYACQIKAMIDSWRRNFHEQSLNLTADDFYFGYVQLAGWQHNDAVGNFPAERWAQTANYGYSPNPDLPNTFMAVAMDLPDFQSPQGSIHPRYKQDVAERLVLGALHVAYGQNDVPFQGPFPTRFTRDDAQQKLTIEYDHGHTPLEIRAEDGFEVQK